MPEHRLQCVVVTPERELLDQPADFIVLPMYDGELGVLPGRAPLIGRLGAGELRIASGNQTQRYYVDGGFAQIRSNVVTVLTDRALRPQEINVQTAERLLHGEQERTLSGPELETRNRNQQRARAQLRVARAAPGTASA
jgi:F-type H+-transporting ATPase subunit epsilon